MITKVIRQMVEANQEVQETKNTDKEFNFRAAEAKWQKEREARVEAERRAAEAERLLQEAAQKKAVIEEDEESSEPYVDQKLLNKKLNKFGQSTQSEIQKAMAVAKESAKEELKKEMWLESHGDFYDVMQNYTEKFAQKAPKLAETILRMPDGFERQKLVYHNIKELGLDKPEQKAPSIQDKIDANKKSPYYQPSNVAGAPYQMAGDFSQTGQKNAYDQMQKLKARIQR